MVITLLQIGTIIQITVKGFYWLLASLSEGQLIDFTPLYCYCIVIMEQSETSYTVTKTVTAAKLCQSWFNYFLSKTCKNLQKKDQILKARYKSYFTFTFIIIFRLHLFFGLFSLFFYTGKRDVTWFLFFFFFFPPSVSVANKSWMNHTSGCYLPLCNLGLYKMPALRVFNS